nr:VacJ family lipoprotein [Caulobacter segnis]
MNIKADGPVTWAAASLAAALGLGLLAPVHARQPATAATGATGGEVGDPLIAFNRASFGFTRGVDRWAMGPIVRGYMALTPRRVRARLGAAVANLGEPVTALNALAQGHARQASRATGRFVINSTLGVAGLFDVAARAGLEPREADFGQTLGRYGARPGAYVFLPLLGPTTVRDGLGRIADSLADPISLASGGYGSDFGRARLGATAVTQREAADPAVRALEDAADPYAAVRAAYLQHRAFVVAQARGEAAKLPDFEPIAATDL